ncbi:MAG: aldose epimerase [Paenibacillus sp.]|jgi:aldose 1-epimerase|nr:aldose epimerase [Paenibacillus sp.]
MTKTVSSAYEGDFQGQKAIWLRYGAYEAAIIPELGGNLAVFRETERGFKLIREPSESEMAAFVNRPMVHGIPVLFPPNRYEDGKFPWNGKTYQLPVEETARQNHIHGFFFDIPWQVEGYGADESSSYVVVAQRVAEGHKAYTYFPHAFTIKIRYSLSKEGLKQEVGIRNDGREAMPCTIGFHTSLKAPFAEGSAKEDYVLKMTIGKAVELTERMLPTGNYLPLDANEEKLKTGGVSPYFAPLDHHYTAEPQNGRNVMELTDTRLNVKLVYDAGTAYKFWMIYNADANSGFFCPEPQTNMVNAPNAPFSAEEAGLARIEPGEVWQETSRMYCENV